MCAFGPIERVDASDPPRLNFGTKPSTVEIAISENAVLPNDDEEVSPGEILLHAARNAMAAEEYGKAIERYLKLLELHPDDSEARQELAGCLFHLGKVEEAVAQYRKLVEIAPEDADTLCHLIDGLLNLGDHPQAKRFLEKGLRKWPGRADFALKLGQLYALENHHRRANQIAMQYLDGTPFEKESQQLDAANLLLLLKHPRRAWIYLEPLLQSDPRRPEILSAAIQYYTLSGDFSKSRKTLEQFDQWFPREIDRRMYLAEMLYSMGYYTLSRRCFQRILEIQPRNVTALIGAARIALRDDRNEEAQKYLSEVPPEARQRTWALTLAEKRILSGQYGSASRLLHQLLHFNPNDTKARCTLGNLYRAQQEFVKADHQYRTVLTEDPTHRQAKLEWAISLYLQRRIEESLFQCRKLLEQNRSDVEALRWLTKCHIFRGTPEKALQAIQNAEQRDDLDQNAGMLLCSLEGEVHLALHQYSLAEIKFREAIEKNPRHSAEAWYGRYRAACAKGEANREWLLDGMKNQDFPLHYALAISDRAIEDGDLSLAGRMLREAERLAPDRINVMAKRGIWKSIQGTETSAREAIDLLRKVLTRQEDNDLARLALARSQVTAQCREAALRTYRDLGHRRPWNLVIAREEARLRWYAESPKAGKRSYRGAILFRSGAYSEDAEELESPTTPERAPVEKPTPPPLVSREGSPTGEEKQSAPASENDPLKFRQWSYMAALKQPGPSAAVPNEEVLEKEIYLLKLECAAQAQKVPHPIRATDNYSRLLWEEPYQQNLRFELGQTYGVLDETQMAISSYCSLLANDPNHRDARIALSGKRWQLHPYLDTEFRFQRERGRNGLTSIDRLRVPTLGFWMPGENEDELIGFQYSLLNLSTTDDLTIGGSGLRGRYRHRLPKDWGDRLGAFETPQFFADVEVQIYDHVVRTRPVLQSGLKWRTRGDTLWTIAGTMDNVLENSESLRQDLHRYGLFASMTKQWTQRWRNEFMYTSRWYSDNNWENIVDFRNRYELNQPPNQWFLLGDYRFWNFDSQSVFQPAPDTLIGMRHPYFTPDRFSQFDLGLEYRRWLSRKRYDGAPTCWLSFAYRHRWDSNAQDYNLYRGSLHWDITRRWGGNALVEYTDSPVYHSTAAWGQLRRRW